MKQQPAPAPTPPPSLELPAWVVEHFGLRELQHAADMAQLKAMNAQLAEQLRRLQPAADAE